MKDFDDFAQLVDRTTDQDMARIFANVIEQMNLPKDANRNVSFSVEDLMPFSTAVSNARTMALLRKYHEWANAEERELLQLLLQASRLSHCLRVSCLSARLTDRRAQTQQNPHLLEREHSEASAP